MFIIDHLFLLMRDSLLLKHLSVYQTLQLRICKWVLEVKAMQFCTVHQVPGWVYWFNLHQFKQTPRCDL